MTSDWDRAALALTVLAKAPQGLGGTVIRMRAGPDRDALVCFAKRLFPDAIRISPNVDDVHLFGGIDTVSTLATGQVRTRKGLLETQQVLMLTMAERCSPALSARLSQYLDATPGAILLALDESADDTECVPPSLSERLAFHIEPTGHPPQGWSRPSTQPDPSRSIAPNPIETLSETAALFGIQSMRAVLYALQSARVLQTMAGRSKVTQAHLATAAALVFSHRATQTPTEQELQNTPPDTPDHSNKDTVRDPATLPEGDVIIDAIKALLPPEVLAGLGRIGPARKAAGMGAGRKKHSNRRGRPLPSRPGRLDGRNRLDVLATMRAAAPWQPLRRQQQPTRTGLLLRPSDFRIKRYETKSDRLLVFAVDASGSAAISRLNEVKGAIELLLGQAYAARDHISLVTFRGTNADTLLPPTRSLVQAKRKLSAMPGGGGTPLAAGLYEALGIAMQGRSKGMSPVIVLLTDGKTNITLGGIADRGRAREDAVKACTQLRTQGIETLVIDSAIRPQTALRDLSQHLDGTYVPLPRADAQRMSGAVKAALDRA